MVTGDGGQLELDVGLALCVEVETPTLQARLRCGWAD